LQKNQNFNKTLNLKNSGLSEKIIPYQHNLSENLLVLVVGVLFDLKLKKFWIEVI